MTERTEIEDLVHDHGVATAAKELAEAALAEKRAALAEKRHRMMELIAECRELSFDIGGIKTFLGQAAHQPDQWRTVLADLVTQGQELRIPEELTTAVFNPIHEDSVQLQHENRADTDS